MINLVYFNDCKIYNDLKKYVNKNLLDVVKVFIDYLVDSNDCDINYFLPLQNLRADVYFWNQKVYELFEILNSQSTRNYINPYYEYLLYLILQWHVDCNLDNTESIIFDIPEDLKSLIKNSDDVDEEEKN